MQTIQAAEELPLMQAESQREPSTIMYDAKGNRVTIVHRSDCRRSRNSIALHTADGAKVPRDSVSVGCTTKYTCRRSIVNLRRLVVGFCIRNILAYFRKRNP